MTVDQLFRQQESVFNKCMNLPLKKCINYVVSLNNDEELKNIPGAFYVDQIQDKTMV